MNGSEAGREDVISMLDVCNKGPKGQGGQGRAGKGAKLR